MRTCLQNKGKKTEKVWPTQSIWWPPCQPGLYRETIPMLEFARWLSAPAPSLVPTWQSRERHASKILMYTNKNKNKTQYNQNTSLLLSLSKAHILAFQLSLYFTSLNYTHKTQILTQHSTSHQNVKECFCIAAVVKFCSRSIKKLSYCFQISTSFS